jgi:predicted MPP superfamily phosphohydrolase
MFFSVMCTLMGSAHYYLWLRFFDAPQLGDGWRDAGAILCAALAVATPGGMLASRILKREHAKRVADAAYIWMGTAVLLLTGLGASEIARVAAHLIGASLPDPFSARVIAAGVAVAALVFAVRGIASALGDVAVKRVNVTLERLPADMSGYRMVQLSDLHIGSTLGREWLSQVVERVNALEPHAVVITGDLVDGSVQRLREHVAPLSDLRAEHGVFFVTGNHEYYSGVDAWLQELQRLGVQPLRNERVSMGNGKASFDLAGVDDWTAFGKGHGPDLARALDGRDPSRELVLLAHQPKQIHQAEKHGVGLQLSGHTHGGQIVPWNFFVRLQQGRFVAGLTRLGATQIYVSRGTGFWGPPMRVGAPAEITLLELHAGGS